MEIRPSDKNDFTRTFLPRDLLCKHSGWMSDRLPSVRSWPVIDWEEIEEDSHAPICYTDVHNFAKFLHQGKVEFSINPDVLMDKVEFTSAWCLGATLICPQYQNEIISRIRYYDNLVANKMVGCECELGCGKPEGIARLLASEDITTLGNTGFSILDYEKNKLFSYFLDKIIWDSIQGGERWEDVVHHGTCLAVATTKALVKATKMKAPTYPPWSPFNSGKYNVAEEKEPEPVNTLVSSMSGEKSRKRKNGGCC